ncbi:hypothetical protein JOF53_003241 [Crossiella equi]|uniref:DUF3995 domain-containing protein n=1 Tax=Crossiella equi TaxID=130796 RepID=A0ABS5ADS8_9PSEU|nr:DUF3995 domain-containing protein [Crossiella equi]MBP2474369.1 hypothetical protein [Crossiella equi]
MTGDRRWATGVALACVGAYGLLKLAWACGSTVLMAQTPLGPEDRELLLGDNAFALLVHVVSVGVAAGGALVVLGLATSWRHRVPRWLLFGPAWLGVVFLSGRVLAGLSADVVTLIGVAGPEQRYLALWDLALWTPFWFVLGAALLVLIRPSSNGVVHPA